MGIALAISNHVVHLLRGHETSRESRQVTLRGVSGLGRREDTAATLWDFSYGGLGIELPHALTPEEEVEVDANPRGEQ